MRNLFAFPLLCVVAFAQQQAPQQQAPHHDQTKVQLQEQYDKAVARAREVAAEPYTKPPELTAEVKYQLKAKEIEVLRLGAEAKLAGEKFLAAKREMADLSAKHTPSGYVLLENLNLVRPEAADPVTAKTFEEMLHWQRLAEEAKKKQK